MWLVATEYIPLQLLVRYCGGGSKSCVLYYYGAVLRSTADKHYIARRRSLSLLYHPSDESRIIILLF